MTQPLAMVPDAGNVMAGVGGMILCELRMEDGQPVGMPFNGHNPLPVVLTNPATTPDVTAVRVVPPELVGAPVTATVTTTAQTIATLAAPLIAQGATQLSAVAAGAVIPVLGGVSLTALGIGGSVTGPRGERLLTVAEAGQVSLKVALTPTTAIIWGYR